MPQEPVIVVAGAPRCGSSLVMRMLYVGGVDVVANLGLQSFEDRRCQAVPIPSSFMALCPGKAIKVLDPHRCQLPRAFRYQLIWLSRTPHEQARSMVKFMRAIGLAVPVGRTDLDRLAASIARDAEKFRQLQPQLSVTRLDLHFEDVLAEPRQAATQIATFLGRPLDVVAMAAAVVRRSPVCFTGMLELDQLEARREVRA